jgi:hypothetical protein
MDTRFAPVDRRFASVERRVDGFDAGVAALIKRQLDE